MKMKCKIRSEIKLYFSLTGSRRKQQFKKYNNNDNNKDLYSAKSLKSKALRSGPHYMIRQCEY